MENILVPFGKYKGQSLDVLQGDSQYVEWIQTQDWFINKYPHINTLIINNFNQPNDTPEHNALVSKFLDESIIISLFSKYIYLYHEIRMNFTEGYWIYPIQAYDIPENIGYSLNNFKYNIDFETKAGNDIFIYNVSFDYEIDYKSSKIKCNLSTEEFSDFFSGKIENKHFEFSEDMGILFKYSKRVELDLFYNSKEGRHYQSTSGVRGYNPRYGLAIECKPTVSDDFPSVLRQCKSQDTNILVIGSYTGSGATLDQVRKMFGNIKIILLSEI